MIFVIYPNLFFLFHHEKTAENLKLLCDTFLVPLSRSPSEGIVYTIERYGYSYCCRLG